MVSAPRTLSSSSRQLPFLHSPSVRGCFVALRFISVFSRFGLGASPSPATPRRHPIRRAMSLSKIGAPAAWPRRPAPARASVSLTPGTTSPRGSRPQGCRPHELCRRSRRPCPLLGLRSRRQGPRHHCGIARLEGQPHRHRRGRPDADLVWPRCSAPPARHYRRHQRRHPLGGRQRRPVVNISSRDPNYLITSVRAPLSRGSNTPGPTGHPVLASGNENPLGLDCSAARLRRPERRHVDIRAGDEIARTPARSATPMEHRSLRGIGAAPRPATFSPLLEAGGVHQYAARAGTSMPRRTWPAPGRCWRRVRPAAAATGCSDCRPRGVMRRQQLGLRGRLDIAGPQPLTVHPSLCSRPARAPAAPAGRGIRSTSRSAAGRVHLSGRRSAAPRPGRQEPVPPTAAVPARQTQGCLLALGDQADVESSSISRRALCRRPRVRDRRRRCLVRRR